MRGRRGSCYEGSARARMTRCRAAVCGPVLSRRFSGGSLVSSRASPIRFTRLFLRDHEPQIALTALTRLRWLAVVGQVGAMGVALSFLQLPLPIVPMGLVIAVTAVTNAGVVLKMRRGHAPSRWLVQWLLLLDVGSLTTL